MSISREEALKLAKERGLVPQDQTLTSNLSKQDAFKMASDRGLIKPREDGAGFLTRTKFSFADTPQGQKQVLEEDYGKGNALKVGDRWVVKDDKGWNYVDENSLSWNDAADLVGDIPEMVGAGYGAVAGMGMASVPMAGLGGAAGDGVKKLIAKAMGINDNQSAGEIAKDLGESAAWSAGGQFAGLKALQAFNKVKAPFAKAMTPEAVARKAQASKYGIELTPAQITQSPTLGQAENIMHNKYWSSDDLAKFAEEKQLSPFNDAIKKMTPSRNTSEIGEAIADSIVKTKDGNKVMFNKEYGDLASKIDKPIETNRLFNQAAEILDENKNIAPSARDTAVKLSSELLDNPNAGMTYQELSKLRTNLGDMALSGKVTNDVGSAQYQRLKGALNQDFDEFATYNGLGSTKKDIDDAYRVFKNRYENPTVRNIIGTDIKAGMDSEDIVKNIVKPNKTTLLQRVTDASGNKAATKDAVVDEVINKSKIADYTNPLVGTDTVSPTRFATQSHNYGNNLASVGADDVRELGKVAESIKFSDSFANHSNTAPTLMNSTVWGMTNPLNMMGKVYTSNGGRKWLTEGFKQTATEGKGIKPKINKSFGAVMGA